VQVEDIAYPTSEIPTTTTTVTRNADSLTVPSVSSSGTIYQKYFDLATRAYVESTTAYTSGSAIPFTTGRGYVATRIASGTKTQADMQAMVYDSGWLDAFPSGKTLEDVDDMPLNVLKIFDVDDAITARYWSCQIDDGQNANGYVDIARFLVTGAYEPTVPIDTGGNFGIETTSQRIVGDSGSATYVKRPRTRAAKFVLGNLSESEALGDNLKLQRLVGTTEQFVLCLDTEATTYLDEQTFLATLRNLSPLEQAAYPVYTVPYEAVEDI
jgi:hypothetical protein